MKKNHVFLGMSCARRQFNLAERVSGALIVDIETASPAAKAGLEIGDVILEINHQVVNGPEHALELSRCIKQQRVLLRVWTGGRTRYIPVESEPLNHFQPWPSP